MTDIQEQIVRIARVCRVRGRTMTYAELAKKLGYDVDAKPEFAQYAHTWAYRCGLACSRSRRDSDAAAVAAAFVPEKSSK